MPVRQGTTDNPGLQLVLELSAAARLLFTVSTSAPFCGYRSSAEAEYLHASGTTVRAFDGGKRATAIHGENR